MSVLSWSNVAVEARGRGILADVSLSLEDAEFIALIGPNGAGKTTLLKTALGLVRPARGQVRLGERDVRALSARERAGLIAWLPQHTQQSEPLSALELVVAARFRFAEARANAERAARAALERAGVAQLASAAITELSGGERQRVWLAALLAQDARVLLLDEPANHLDPAQQIDTYRLLAELWRSGFSCVLVTHDVNLLAELGAPERVRVVGLAKGHVAFESRYAAEALPDALAALFGVGFDAVAHAGRRLLLARGAPPRTC